MHGQRNIKINVITVTELRERSDNCPSIDNLIEN
jgi:hypothetical protein